ncbi:PREDICTED: uncharacterized protein LOC108781763 [Cyphomyrmex costatus]|uniref:Uncharacterized protein n=1 Tax=Cyphomyrmex costatus TaxID=456900 RepID=A0A195D3I2_9HYME|nr:PREDICTED: uncharacterized protein LOC108781763 [Cyphomyrmex costatus]KYN07416.1 hypothetical protein ALC62_01618 [Cyphomyrmex costatus]
MAAFDLLCSSLPFVLIVTLFVATLTSSINAVTASTSSEPSMPSRGSPTEPLSYSTSTVEPLNVTGDKEVSPYSSVAEGGPIITSQHGSTTVESNEARTRENAPKERHATPSVVARKGVDKIKPRKGVTEISQITPTKVIYQYMDPEKENVLFNQTTFENMKIPTMKSSPAIETAHIKSKTSNVHIPKLSTNNPRSDDSLNHRITSNYSNTSINETTAHLDIMNNMTTKISMHVEKHIPKPKPTVTTVDGPEINESIPLSRTKNPPLGMPRKIDYIVPVIITIVALPILGAAIFILYRRGRDCWDKRHYRRMDFLIDGMYND